MTTLDVQAIRAMAPAGAIIEVFCDNALIYYAGPAKDYEFIWDDTKGCFYQIRPNVSAYTQVQSPVEITAVPYEHIQRMVFKTNLQETIDFLKARGKTNDEVQQIITRVRVLGGELRNTTHIQTEVGYADGAVKKEVPEQQP